MPAKQHRSLPSVCLFCGGRLGFWNRLLKRKFCCADHELQHCDELTVIAIERLDKNRDATPSSANGSVGEAGV